MKGGSTVRSTDGRRGQALVLFALFLLVLIGASALAIDYANWLLIDRQLQNVTDHAALAGAADFSSDFSTATCGGGSNPSECINARAHAWTAVFQDLGVGDPTTDANAAAAVTQLAQSDSPAAGVTSVTVVGHPTITFNRTIWVSTPPPSGGGHTEYTGLGGRYSRNYGVMFVRVDEPTRSYLAGVFGLTVNDRIGWATAGILPTDFALDVFCRDQVAPEHGVCANSSSLSIDGGGGISLDKGDVGSSNSLKVTQQGGSGVVVKKGNVFLVEGACGSSTWNCPPTTAGGISDGAGTAKNAFYIPPIPVPNYALPSGIDSTTCASAACVPGTGTNNATPMDWTCPGGVCGQATITTIGGVSTIECSGTAGIQTRDLRPTADNLASPNNSWNAGGPGKVNGSNLYPNVNEAAVDPSGTTLPGPPSGATTFPATPVPNSYVASKDGTNGAQYRVTLSSPNGTPQTPGFLYVRYVLFKTLSNAYDAAGAGNAVSVTVQLQEKVGGSWVNRGSPDTESATGTITGYQVPAVDVASITNPNALGLLFTVATTNSGNNNPANRGAGISWAEAYLDKDPVPPPPPTVPPGMYRSITLTTSAGVTKPCAVMDPTGFSSGGLPQNQMPGIYYFKDGGSGSQKPVIDLGSNGFLIGDGVTLVFADNWPDPTGGQGITMGANSALVLNTGTAATNDCTAYHTTNPSYPLCPLPSDALSAGWMIDPTAPGTGVSPWGGACGSPCSPPRSSYAPTANYRGVSLYFRPKTNGSTDPANYSILGRFSMSGNSGSEPGIAFRGILYAPYDDVVITGGNGFNTIGMVLSWTAKFAGKATIKLDYPYTRVISPPYLLEPTVGQ